MPEPLTPEQERLQTSPTEIEIAELGEAMRQAGITSAGILIYRRLCWQRTAANATIDALRAELDAEREWHRQVEDVIAALEQEARDAAVFEAAALATIDALRDRLEWSKAVFDASKDAIALAADSADRIAAEQEARDA
jgi:hypothetical protein